MRRAHLASRAVFALALALASSMPIVSARAQPANWLDDPAVGTSGLPPWVVHPLLEAELDARPGDAPRALHADARREEAIAAYTYRRSGGIDEADLLSRIGTFAFFVGADPSAPGDAACPWLAATPELAACVSTDGITWTATSPEDAPGTLHEGVARIFEETLREVFVGARRDARILPEAGLVGVLDDRRGPIAGHRTDLPLTRGVRLSALWPGVDLVLERTQSGYKRTWEVAAHGAAHLIAHRFEGAGKLELTADGALALHTEFGQLIESAPIAWQPTPTGPVPVAAAWVVDGLTARLSLGAYDRALPLIIDPHLSFTSPIRGTALASIITATARLQPPGEAERLALGGTIILPDLTQLPIDHRKGPSLRGSDGFVALLRTAAPFQVRFVLLGGTKDDGLPAPPDPNGYGGSDQVSALAASADGLSLFVGGSTSAIDFPVPGTAFQVTRDGSALDTPLKLPPSDLFAVRLDELGASYGAATLYGGEESEIEARLAVLADGSVALGGTSRYRGAGGQEAGIVLFDPGLGTLLGELELPIPAPNATNGYVGLLRLIASGTLLAPVVTAQTENSWTDPTNQLTYTHRSLSRFALTRTVQGLITTRLAGTEKRLYGGDAQTVVTAFLASDPNHYILTGWSHQHVAGCPTLSGPAPDFSTARPFILVLDHTTPNGTCTRLTWMGSAPTQGTSAPYAIARGPAPEGGYVIAGMTFAGSLETLAAHQPLPGGPAVRAMGHDIFVPANNRTLDGDGFFAWFDQFGTPLTVSYLGGAGRSVTDGLGDGILSVTLGANDRILLGGRTTSGIIPGANTGSGVWGAALPQNPGPVSLQHRAGLAALRSLDVAALRTSEGLPASVARNALIQGPIATRNFGPRTAPNARLVASFDATALPGYDPTVAGAPALPSGCSWLPREASAGAVFTLRCEAGTLARGQLREFQLSLPAATTRGRLGLRLSAHSDRQPPNPDETSLTSTIVVGGHDLEIDASVIPDRVAAGGTARLRFTVTNNGPEKVGPNLPNDPPSPRVIRVTPTPAVTFTPPLPAGCVAAINPPGLACTVATLDPETELTYEVAFTAPSEVGKDYTFRVEALEHPDELDREDDLDEATYAVEASELVVVSAAADPDPTLAGEQTQLTIAWRNAGLVAAEDAIAYFTLDGLALAAGSGCAPVAPGTAALPLLGELVACVLGSPVEPGESRTLIVPVVAPSEPTSRRYLPKVYLNAKGFDPAKKASPLPSHAEIPVCVGCVRLVLAPGPVRTRIGEVDKVADAGLPAAQPAAFAFTVDNTSRVPATQVQVDLTLATDPAQGQFPMREVAVEARRGSAAPVVCPATTGDTYRCTLPEVAAQTDPDSRWTLQVAGLPSRGVARVAAAVIAQDQPQWTPPAGGADTRSAASERPVVPPTVSASVVDGETPLLVSRPGVFSVFLSNTAVEAALSGGAGRLGVGWKAGDFTVQQVRHSSTFTVATGAMASVDTPLACELGSDAVVSCTLPRVEPGTLVTLDLHATPRVAGLRRVEPTISLEPAFDAELSPWTGDVRVRGADLGFDAPNIETHVGQVLASPPTLKNTGLVDATVKLTVRWDPAVFAWEGTPACGSVDAQAGVLSCDTALPAGESAAIPWSLKALKRTPGSPVSLIALTDPVTDEEKPEDNVGTALVKVKGPDLTLTATAQPSPTPVGELVDGMTVELKNQSTAAEARAAGFDYQWDPAILRWEGALECPGQGLLDQALGLAICRYTEPLAPQGTRALPWSFRVLKRDPAKQRVTAKAILEPQLDEENPADNTRLVPIEVAPSDLALAGGFATERPALTVGEASADYTLVTLQNLDRSAIEQASFDLAFVAADLRVESARLVDSGGLTAGTCLSGLTFIQCTLTKKLDFQGSLSVMATVTGLRASPGAVVRWEAKVSPDGLERDLTNNRGQVLVPVTGFDATLTIPEPTPPPIVGRATSLAAQVSMQGPGAIEGGRLTLDVSADATITAAFVSEGACVVQTEGKRYVCTLPRVTAQSPTLVSVTWIGNKARPNLSLTATWDEATLAKLKPEANASATRAMNVRGVRFVSSAVIEPVAPATAAALGYDFDILYTIRNEGQREAEGVDVRIETGLAAEAGLVDAEGCVAGEPGFFNCAIGTLAGGDFRIVRARISAKQRVPSFLSRFTTTTSEPDHVELESSASATVTGSIRGADLSPALTPPTEELSLDGEPRVVGLTVTNAGPGRAYEPKVTVNWKADFHQFYAGQLPSGVTCTDPSPTGGAQGATAMACTFAGVTVEPGESSPRIDLNFQGKKASRTASISALVELPRLEDDENVLNNNAVLPLPVRSADLAPSIPAPLPPLGRGTWSHLTVTVTNQGRGAASGGTLRVTHPTVGALDADGAPGCSVSSNVMTCTDIDLPAPTVGQGLPTLTRTFKVRVTDRAPTTSLTLETALPEDADEEPLNDRNVVTLTVEGPDLAVDGVAPAETWGVGQTRDVTVTLQNLGPGLAEGAKFTLSWDAQALEATENTSSRLASGCVVAAANRVECELTDREPAWSLTLPLELRAIAARPKTEIRLEAAAVPTGDDPRAANNLKLVPVTLKGRDLRAGGTLAGEVRLGKTTPLVATVTNTSGVAVEDVILEVMVDANLKLAEPLPTGCARQSGVVRCEVGTLGANAVGSVTLELEGFKATAGGLASARVLAKPTEGDDTPADNEAVRTIRVVGADLAAAVDPVGLFDSEVPRGQEVTLRATVTSKGARANRSELSLGFSRQHLDYLGFSTNNPPGEACAVSTAAPDRVVCSVMALGDPLDPGADPTTRYFDLRFRAKGSGITSGHALVTPLDPTGDEVPTDNQAGYALTVRGADLGLTAAANPAFPTTGVGAESVGTFMVTNAGPGDSDPTTRLRLLFPSADLGLVSVSFVGNPVICQPEGGGTLACPLGVIPEGPGQRQLTVRFEGKKPGAHPVELALVENFPDEQPTDNTLSLEVQVDGADLGVTMAAAPPTLGTQQAATFSATVTNHGPMAADNARITFTIPAGLRYDAGFVDGAPRCFAAGGALVVCQLGDASQRLANGNSTTVVLTATATAAGTLTVSATASSDTGDPGGAPATAQASVMVSPSLDSDGDGVPDADEDTSPGGDGNGDGIPDAQQRHVASVRSPQGHVATLEAPPGTLLTASSKPAPLPWPAGIAFPMDALELNVPVSTPGAHVTVKVFFPWSVPLWAFWKYAPTTPGGPPSWWQFTWDGTTGACIDPNDPNILLVTFQDGGRGDADGLANGVVKDPLAPALPHLQVDDAGDAPDANPGDGLCATEGDVCTLRAALMEANASGEPTFIDFALTGFPGQLAAFDIVLGSALPAVTVPVILDATRQTIERAGLIGGLIDPLAIPEDPYPDPVFTAEMFAHWPTVALRPFRALPSNPAPFSGPLLDLQAPRSSVHGLLFFHSDGDGLRLAGARGLVSKNLGLWNAGASIHLANASRCRVTDNVLLGAQGSPGFEPTSPMGGVRVVGGEGHAIVKNHLGLLPGTTRRGRMAQRFGVSLEGASHSTVADNRISNALEGVRLTAGAHGNRVADNVLGLNSEGAISRYVLGRRDENTTGLLIDGGAFDNIVSNNAIPNAYHGVHLTGSAHQNILISNRIGTLPGGACPTDGPGHAYLESCSGAEIFAETCPTQAPSCRDVITTWALLVEGGAHHNTIGDSDPAYANTLLGDVGVELRDTATADNRFVQNLVSVQTPTESHARVGVRVMGGTDNHFVGGRLASITVDGRFPESFGLVSGTRFEDLSVGLASDGAPFTPSQTRAITVLGATDTLLADLTVAPGTGGVLSFSEVDGLVVRDSALGVDGRTNPLRSGGDVVFGFGGSRGVVFERATLTGGAGAGLHLQYDRFLAPSAPIEPHEVSVFDSTIGATLERPDAGHLGHGLRIEAPGTYVFDGNLIGGNGEHGLWLHANTGWDFDGETIEATLTRNAIGVSRDGLTPLPNAGSGVVVWDFVGGPIHIGADKDESLPAPLGNLIAHNGGFGVLGVAGGPATVRGNRFFANGRLPVTLGGPSAAAPLPNDPGDTDTGTINGNQNHPVLMGRTGLAVTGTLNSRVGTYVVDVYAVLDPDPSGHGEGGLWLGSAPVTITTAGATSFDLTLIAEPPDNAPLTAMATVMTGAFPGATSEQGPSRCLAANTPNLVTSLYFTRNYSLVTSIPVGSDCDGSGCAVFRAHLRVDNIGDAPATGLTATLALPPELIAMTPPFGNWGADWSCTIDGQRVNCAHVGTLAAGASAIVEIRIEGVSGGVARLEADAATTATECTTFDNPSAATLLVAPRPYFVEFINAPPTTFVGQGLVDQPIVGLARVTHGVVSGDDSPLMNAVLTLESEAGSPVAGFDPACRVVGAAIECTFDALAPNTVIEVPFAFRFAQAGQHPIRAALSAASPPLDASATTTSGLVNALASGLDLAVTLQGPARQTVEVGERATFVFVLENLGTTTETNIVFSASGFQLLTDRAFTLIDGQPGEDCYSSDQLCGFFSLAPGARRTIEVSGTVATLGTRSLSATHSKGSGDVQVRNDTALVELTAVPATGCPSGQSRFTSFEDDAEEDRGVFVEVPIYAQRTTFGGGYQSATTWQVQVALAPDERGGVLATAAPIDVPANAGEARFGFWRFQELALQGANAHAVVEYATGAGPHADSDWLDAMPLVVVGASEAFATSGPFAGRFVWAGNSSYDFNNARIWTRTELDLSSLAGEQVSLRLRVRMVTAFGNARLFADELVLTGCAGEAPPPAEAEVALTANPSTLTVGDTSTVTVSATTRAAGEATLTLSTRSVFPLVPMDAAGVICGIEVDAIVCSWNETESTTDTKTLVFSGRADSPGFTPLEAHLALTSGGETYEASATRVVSATAPPTPDEADLAVSLGEPSPVVDGVATFLATLDNLGPARSGWARLRVSATGAGATLTQDGPASCDDTGEAIVCEVDLEAGASTAWPFTVTALESGLVTVVAEVTRPEELEHPVDPDPSNDVAALVLVAAPPGPPSADLGVTLALSPALVNPGASAALGVTVTNEGPASAESVTLSAVLPLGVGLTLGTSPCVRSGERVSCALGTLAPSSVTTLSWVVSPDSAGSLVAVVSGVIVDPNRDNDLASATFGVIPPVAAPALTLTAPPSALVGTDLALVVRVDNLGPAPSSATAVELMSDDPLAPIVGDGCDPDGPGRVRCALDPVAPSGARTFALTLTSARPGPLALSARLVDGSTTPTTANVTLRPIVRARALSAAPLPAQVDVDTSRTVLLDLSATGEGPPAMTTLTVTATGATLEPLGQVDPRCVADPIDSAALSCALLTTPGVDDTIALSWRPTSPGFVSLTARLGPDPADTEPNDDVLELTSLAVAPSRNLAVSIAGPATMPAGAPRPFPVRVTNTGLSAATTTLRVEVSGATPNVPAGCELLPDDALSCTLTAIAPNAFSELQLSVTAELAGAVVLVASLPAGGDDDPSDDLAARFAFATDPPRDLGVALVAPESAIWGEDLDLTVIVSARSAAHDVVLRLDALGALDAPVSDDVRCVTVDETRLECELGALSPDEEVLIPVRVSAALVGAGQLIASVEASGPSSSPEDDLAMATVDVDSGVALTLSWEAPARADGAGGSFTARLESQLDLGGFEADAFGDIILEIEILDAAIDSADPRCTALESARWSCLLDPAEPSPGPVFEVTPGDVSELVLDARALSVGLAGTYTAERQAIVRVGGPVADLAVTFTSPNPGDLLSPQQARLVVAEVRHLGGDGGAMSSLALNSLFGTYVPVGLDDAGSGCVPGDPGWTCRLPPLTDGEVAEVELWLTPREVGTVGLSATVSSEAFDPDPDNDTATLEALVGLVTADRSVTLAGPTAMAVGDEASFTLSLGQHGPAATAPVGATVLLPPGLVFVASVPPDLCFATADGFTCPAEPLADTTSRVTTITLRATAPGAGVLVALAQGAVEDPVPGNDAALVFVTVTVDCAALTCQTDQTCAVATCSPLTGCVVALADDGALCDAGPCVVGASCVAGQCLGAPRDCDGAASCQVGTCDPVVGCIFEDAPIGCDDGDACTALDLCVDGQCLGFEPLACDDGNACTADGCGEDGCVHTPLSGTPCVLGDPCALGASCVTGQCVATSFRECEDNDPCTVDGCGPSGCEARASSHPACAGECAPERASARCEGGDIHWVDACDASGETAVSCDDGDPMTTDRCDADLDLCVRRLADESCACEGEWEARCEGGALMWFDPCGYAAGVADPCVSDDPCIASVCDDTLAACIETVVDDGACRPAPACNQDASLSCEGDALTWRDGCGADAGLAIACDSSRAWTTGTCDPTTLACVRTPNPQDLPACPTGPVEPAEPVEPVEPGPVEESPEPNPEPAPDPAPDPEDDLGPTEPDHGGTESSGCGGCTGGGAGLWPLLLALLSRARRRRP